MKLLLLKTLVALIMSGIALAPASAANQTETYLAQAASQDTDQAVEDEEGKQEDSELKKKTVEEEEPDEPDHDGDKG